MIIFQQQKQSFDDIYKFRKYLILKNIFVSSKNKVTIW